MPQPVDMARHFSAFELLRYTVPSMAMMLFTSIYTIVDGFFISNFAGKEPFAAVNLIMPFIMVLGTVGFMAGTGGGALVAQARGAGDDERANRIFSMVIIVTLCSGIVLSGVGFAVMPATAVLLGADEQMLPVCVLYGRISMISLTGFVLQFAFQPLFSTAGRPAAGLAFTVASGLLNIALDFVLVGLLGFGVVGAAAATVASELLGGFGSLIYFILPNSSFLRLRLTRIEWRVIGRACANGSSEMMADIAMSVVAVLYNYQLMRYIGADGVAAYGIIMYVSMIFGALLIGYCMGSAPLMSYQHGAGNNVEKRSLLRRGFLIMGIGGAGAFAAAEALAIPVAYVFASYDAQLYGLTVHAFRIFSVAFLLMGVSGFASSTFTALGNGLLSAVISFAHSLVFEAGAVMLLPLAFGVEGIWSSIIVAEVGASALAGACLLYFGPFYGLSRHRS